jgi:hypothetical protein
MAWGNGANINTLAARWGAASPRGSETLAHSWVAKNEIATIMSSAEHIYSIADNHVQTVQVCIDRLHELGADEQLELLTEGCKNWPSGRNRETMR